MMRTQLALEKPITTEFNISICEEIMTCRQNQGRRTLMAVAGRQLPPHRRVYRDDNRPTSLRLAMFG